ncbi:gliding motility-associated C-terminal domain-containing protein [Lewinella sp. LCG006]|uniref:T9SS type B sorting domain-containing protein n=1 Tax=Lewinella sp. LCG006 TaxID=3231911 RepID=UPI003460BC0D
MKQRLLASFSSAFAHSRMEKLLLTGLLFFVGINLHAQVHCKIFFYLDPDICNTDNILLRAQPWHTMVEPITYIWSTGETTQSISIPSAVGTYSVTVTDNAGCTTSGTFEVNPTLFDYYIEVFNGCPGDPLFLGVVWNQLHEPSTFTYEWSTGDTGPSIEVSGAGFYSVTITDPATGCSTTLSRDVAYFDAPNPTISGPTSLCNSGSVTLEVQGGPYVQYYWDPYVGDFETVVITQPGTYSVTVLDENNCYGDATVEVTTGATTPIINQTVPLCGNQPGMLHVANESSFNTFQWNTGGSGPTLAIDQAGTYTVTTTDASGCTATQNFEVLPAEIGIFGNVSPLTSCTAANGSIVVNMLPFGNYTFNWSNGSQTANITGLSAGSYTITVTNEAGCSQTADFQIDDLTTMPVVTLQTTPSSCGGNNGAIAADVFPSGNYTYLWSNGEATASIDNLSEGTYSLTVTDNNGCTTTETAFVSADGGAGISLFITAFDNNSCTIPDGSIDLTILEPGSYIYLWSNGESTEDLTGIAPGAYSVTVTGSGGCSQTTSVVVGDAATLPQVGGQATPALCGQADGSINLAVSPAIGNSFAWSNGDSSEDITNLLPGDYSVTVTAANGCESLATFTVGNTDATITLQAVGADNTSCSSPNGSIDLTVAEPGSYNFLWSTGAQTEDLTQIEAGFYSVTVTDGNGCSAQTAVVVNAASDAPQLSAITQEALCQQATGSINLAVSPALGNSFAWSNGDSSEDIANLLPGDYSVTVTAANGCTATQTISVGNTDATITLLAVGADNTSCSSPNGSIDLTVAEPGSYNFLWSTGAQTEDLTQIGAGTYSVTVTDGNGCSAQTAVVVNAASDAPQLSATPQEALCQQATGSINLAVSPAIGNTFVWSNGDSSEDIANLLPGDYSVTVTAANGCTATQTISVGNTDATITLQAVSADNTSCSFPNGSIDLTILEPGSYNFLWSTGAQTEDLTQIGAGSYSVTVTDGNGCSAQTAVVVNAASDAPQLSATPQEALCQQATGSINLAVSPAIGNTFVWSNGDSSEDIANLLPGDYSVTVTAANGCTATQTISVGNTDATITLQAVSADNTSCSFPNGSIDLTILEPGSYNFLWSTGAQTEDLTQIGAGFYSVTVTDGNGCSAQTSVVVNAASDALQLSATPQEALCQQATGSINLAVSPALGNTFVWSNGDSSEDITNLLPGDYSVTVTAANGCTATQTISVGNTDASITLQAVGADNTSCSSPNGSIDLTVAEPGSYNFLWSTGAQTEDLTQIGAGTYSVTVTDGNGCSAQTAVVVNAASDAPQLSATPQEALCQQATGSINLAVSPPLGNSFAWSNGDSSEDIANLLPGDYSVTVTAANGCTATQTISVGNTDATITLQTVGADNTSCSFPNGSIDLTILEPGSYNFLWSNGAQTEDLTQIGAGTYSVTVTDGNGCSAQTAVVVNAASDAPQLSATPQEALCQQATGSINLAVSPALGNSFAWSNGDSSEDITGLLPGDYSVTVTAANGCTATQTISVGNTDASITLQAVGADNTSCSSPNGSIDLTVAEPGSYNFLWSNGAQTEDLTQIGAGFYSVTVTDGNGCSAQTAVVVNAASDAPQLSATPQEALCQQATGSINLAVSPALGNTFVWSNGDSSEDITGLLPGDYSVTVTAANGCTATQTISVGNTDATITLQAVGADNTSCSSPNGSIDLTVAEPGSYNFLWSNGAQTEDLTQIGAGTYSVTVTDGNGCSAQTSVVIAPPTLPTLQISGADTLCEGTPTTLVADAGFATYAWSNGGSTASITVQTGGVYALTVTDAGGCLATQQWTLTGLPSSLTTLTNYTCQAADTGTVVTTYTNQAGCDSVVVVHTELLATSMTEVNLSACTGETVTFDGIPIMAGDSQFFTYTSSNGCDSIVHVAVSVLSPLQVETSDAILDCTQREVVLSPLVSGGAEEDQLSFVWSDGSTEPSLLVDAAGTYSVRISNICQSTIYTMRVRYIPDETLRDAFYVPNCFSPNNDGNNDVFQVFPNPAFELLNFEFRVFDRWGDAMFLTNDIQKGWDGIFRGQEKQPEVYVWYLKAQLVLCDGSLREYFNKGDVTIVR